jgi:hypothetical protein
MCLDLDIRYGCGTAQGHIALLQQLSRDALLLWLGHAA